MPLNFDDDIFELPIPNKPEVGEEKEDDDKPTRKRSTRKKKTTVKKKRVSKKKTTSKEDEEPALQELDEDLPPTSGEDTETRIADSVDRSALIDQSADNMIDTMPVAEDALTKAKRENSNVARWDKFLSKLRRGTLKQIYEMAISGLEEGERPLVSFRRSDLLKPRGEMLEQHVDEIESVMFEFDLFLMEENPDRLGRVPLGEKLPDLSNRGRGNRSPRKIRRTS